MAERRKMRFTLEDLELTKALFSENEEMLLTLRKIFWQEDLTKDEQKIFDASFKKNPKAINLLKMFFLPVLDSSAPRHQVVDLWLTLDLKDKGFEESILAIEVRRKLISYVEGTFAEIEKGTLNPISFKKLTEDNDNILVNLMMRNYLLQHVEQQLTSIDVLAGHKKESVEETRARLEKNSSK